MLAATKVDLLQLLDLSCFALFQESLSKFREAYRDMVAFVRGYRQEDIADDDEGSSLGARPLVQFDTDDTEAEYKAVGERIELSKFCTPAGLSFNNTECSVCITGLNPAKKDQDQHAVLTKCGHTFHELCLDTWINDSGMKASNTCSVCRTVLCEPRERAHAYMEAYAVTDLDAYDYASVSDGSIIESFTALPPHPRVP